VATLIYGSLLWKDANGTTIPWLATAREVSADGREWRSPFVRACAGTTALP